MQASQEGGARGSTVAMHTLGVVCLLVLILEAAEEHLLLLWLAGLIPQLDATVRALPFGTSPLSPSVQSPPHCLEQPAGKDSLASSSTEIRFYLACL